MARHLFRLQWLASAALVGLGSFVMLGWLTRQGWMVQLQTGLVAVVFNTALSFLLAGVGMAALGSSGRTARWTVLACAGLILAVSTLVLGQFFAGVSIGVDAIALHAWLSDGNPHPGRMAPNACIGFILGAFVLIGLATITGPPSARRWRVLRGLVFALFLTALTGFVGYWLRTDLVLEWRHVRMALSTAVGMLVLSIGLWSVLERRSPPSLETSARQIGRAAAVVLTAIVLAAGLSGFAILVGQTEGTIKSGLKQRLDFRVALLEDALRDGRTDAAILASAPALVDFVTRSEEDGSRPVPLILGHGLSGLQIVSLRGRVLLSEGAMAQAPLVDVPLDANGHDRLRWQGMLLLRTLTPVRAVDGRVVAHLVAERAMPQLAKRLTDVPEDYPSGEILICADGGEAQLTCLPDALNTGVFRFPRESSSGKPLPIARALAGEAGVGSFVDYRGINVCRVCAGRRRRRGHGGEAGRFGDLRTDQ